MVWLGKYLLVFAMGFAATWLSTRRTRRVVGDDPRIAARYCAILSTVVVAATYLYVNDLKTAPALIIGNALGTYWSMRTDRKRDVGER